MLILLGAFVLALGLAAGVWILTPEESDFLKVLGLGWIEPGEREARWSR